MGPRLRSGAAWRAALSGGADLVTMVHAETSTGVLNPVGELCALASARGAMTIVDAVTSLGAHPVDAAGWGADVVYSCTQKGLGAPSGLAPIVFSPRARAQSGFRLQAEGPRSFYFDLKLLEDYWVNRKYHHTISAPLVYALREALVAVEEEGLEARWERHRVNHLALVDALAALGLQLLPPPAERLWSLNAVSVPAGVDEARRPEAAARRIQHRDRRRARAARRQDLARRPDGIGIDAREHHAPHRRAEDAARVKKQSAWRRAARDRARDRGGPRRRVRRRPPTST